MPKRARTVTVPSHCSSCGESMKKMACSIDWHAVYLSQLFKEFLIQNAFLPPQKELEVMNQSVGSDPCDDCCCGSCGSRKRTPGEVCC